MAPIQEARAAAPAITSIDPGSGSPKTHRATSAPMTAPTTAASSTVRLRLR